MSTDAGTTPAPKATRREWLGLVVLALPTMLIAMGLTVLHLALPTITADLRPGNTELLWIGAWTGFFGLGTVIGPLVGGTFLELFWWGSVFLLGVPVMLLLIVLGPLVLPEYRDKSVSRPDLISAMMSIVGVLALIFGLKRIAEDGLRPDSGIAIVVGLALAALFISRQRRLEQPLVDLSLFRNGVFGTALGMLVLATLLSAASQFFVMQYLQLVRGLPPIQAGLWSLPTTIAVMIGAMAAPGLASRMKLSKLLAGGLVVTAVGMVALTRVSGPSDLYVAVTGAAVIGLGLGPMVALGTGLIVGAAPPERAGAASAMASTGTELGSALAIAVFGSIGFAVYRAQLADRLPEGLPAPVVETAKDSLAAAVNVARELPAAQGSGLLSVAREAFVYGLQTTAIVGAVLAMLLAIAAAALLRNARTPSPPPSGEPDNAAKSFEKLHN
ncbi:MFS transporter [Dactylosporangium fulvum]|uniref:MFS transporter n=1 Tax=Dactylosporangium fulvum TaxID=53359 RepID=A0ABY5WB97_9ACTN|nr:MFS transporter [Dactylosporangium fulvum]UWP86739.1 MFS transporter [Dactylosporangium fulvum]